jgi:hypothetical protein
MSSDFLHQLIGEWEGTTKTWFEPGALADESPWRGTFRPVHGGHFIVHEYEGRMQGKPFTGQQTWCFNPMLSRWECAWIDSFHNDREIMYAVGTGAEPNVLGQFHVADGTAWGWRTTLELRAPDELVLTMYVITPEGEESTGVETLYRRVTQG